jgi:hypothetical protein
MTNEAAGDTQRIIIEFLRRASTAQAQAAAN